MLGRPALIQSRNVHRSRVRSASIVTAVSAMTITIGSSICKSAGRADVELVVRYADVEHEASPC